MDAVVEVGLRSAWNLAFEQRLSARGMPAEVHGRRVDVRMSAVFQISMNLDRMAAA